MVWFRLVVNGYTDHKWPAGAAAMEETCPYAASRDGAAAEPGVILAYENHKRVKLMDGREIAVMLSSG
jgi:hypothetical protein